MVAKELSPLRRRGTGLCVLDRFDQRPGVAAGESKEEMLIDLKIKHHLQPFARIPKILQVCIRQDVCLSQNDRLSLSPGQEFAEGSQHVVLLGGSGQASAFFRNDKG